MTARHLLRPSFSSECIIPLYFNKYLSVCRNISIVLQSYTFFTKKPHNLSLFFFHIPVHCAPFTELLRLFPVEQQGSRNLRKPLFFSFSKQFCILKLSAKSVVSSKQGDVFFQIKSKEYTHINTHGNRRVAMFHLRDRQSCHCCPVGNVLHREMPALACQHNLFTHDFQVLAQSPWHRFAKRILSHNCILLGTKLYKTV